MVTSNKWLDWLDYNTKASCEFELTILGHQLWQTTENLDFDLQPFYTVLCLDDKKGCIMGLLYEYILEVVELLIEANWLTIEQQQDVVEIWNVWWGWFYKLIHILANKLHPL